jgi:Protein of unknown function (DUF2844)
VIDTRARQVRKIVARFALIVPFALGFAPLAGAALGDIEASVFADQSQIKATLRTVPNTRYTMHELQAPSGTAVREYVGPTGIVFGVAWQGPLMPDLRQVLGAHYDEYVAAVAARRTRRGPVSVELPGLVVQSSGRMRGFVGKAYVPETLPPGVSVEEVR